jgi:hypothetical protein
MERFDPAMAAQPAFLASPGWERASIASRDAGFGERAIGELVRAIVARLDEGNARARATP